MVRELPLLLLLLLGAAPARALGAPVTPPALCGAWNGTCAPLAPAGPAAATHARGAWAFAGVSVGSVSHWRELFFGAGEAGGAGDACAAGAGDVRVDLAGAFQASV